MRVQCTGVLTKEENEYSLSGKTSYGSINNVWCDAAFSRDIEKAYEALMKSACRWTTSVK
jgi:hypothetical protein